MKWRREQRESRRLAAEYEAACTRPMNVAVFGAVGDEMTDDAPAIQAAINFIGRYDLPRRRVIR